MEGATMMRKFVVNVNGNRYEVDVEEVGVSVPAVPAMGTATAAAPASTAVETPAAPAATAPAPAQRAESAPAPQAAPSGVAGSIEITSPMPGNILDIKVNTGESVKKGTVIAILEAMKMENEILAPKDAVVASIDVSRNQQVNSGDVIMTLN
jgi:biotin carboxyl carrier protein